MIAVNDHKQILETFISIKIDAECNETAHAIVFDRFHVYFHIATKMIPNMTHKNDLGWRRYIHRVVTQQQNISTYINNRYGKATVGMRLRVITKIKKYKV